MEHRNAQANPKTIMKTTGHLSTRRPCRQPHTTSTPCHKPARFLPLTLLLGAGLLLAVPRSHGAIYSWSGNGSTGNWSESANWGYVGIPGNGDTVIFSAGQPRLTNTNNISGLSLCQIRFVGTAGGYSIYGNSFTINCSSIEATNTAGANTIYNAITLSASPVTVNVGSGASLTLAGALSGTGGLTKTGAGTLTYSGATANTYSGATTVNDGTLLLSKTIANGSIVAGTLTIGDGSGAADSAVVRLATTSQLGTTPDIIINDDGLFDLNDITEAIGDSLTLNGGKIQTGTGSLSLAGNSTITVSGSSYIYDLLSIGSGICTIQGSGNLYVYAIVSGSADIVKNGTVAVYLYAANTFTGTLTANTGGYISAQNNLALGATNGGTIINDTAELILYNASITNEALTMNSTDTYALDSSGSSVNSWSGPITLSRATSVYVGPSGSLDIIGPITGTGGVTKRGAGTLSYSGSADNNYSGNTTVNEGLLQLNKSANWAIGYGTLIVGDGVGGDGVDIVRYTGASTSQIDDLADIVVNSSGLLDLNGHSDGVGNITLNGGDITLGTATMTLDFGTVAVNNSSSIINGPSGAVSLGSAITFNVASGIFFDLQAPVAGSGTLTKIGTGTMRLGHAGTYTGLTTVNAGTLDAWNAQSLGSTVGATRVNSGGTLLIYGDTTYTGETLYLNGTGAPGYGALFIWYDGVNSWTGPVSLESNCTIQLYDAGINYTFSGIINGSGGLTKYGPGTMTMGGTDANTYSGTTTVNEGTLVLSKTSGVKSVTGNLVIGDASGSDVVRLGSNNQIASTADVYIQPSGLLDCAAAYAYIDTLHGTGTVNFGTNGWLAVCYNGGTSTFDGPMTGIGYAAGYTLGKHGNGTFTLNGNASFSAGITHVYDSGKLIVNGSLARAVTVDSGATLGGTGTVGALTANGAIAPGASPGCLTCGNVTFGSSSSLGIELNGNTACSGYDRLNVVGTVNLTGAALPPVTVGFLPKQGDQFTIVANDSTDAVTGTFDSLAEGAVVTDSTGKFNFRVSYAGSSGNDVVLTMTNLSLTAGPAVVWSGNGNGAIETDECNLLNLTINNISASAMSGLSATLQSLTPGVVVTQPYSSYPDIPASGSRANDAHFQVSTQPGFACGNTVDLELQVASTTDGTLKVPFSLPSGVAGSSVRYNNNVTTAIPDAGYVDKTFTVSGITTPLKKVVVSLHITHTADSDLDISLIGPDGTTVNLSSDNGGTSSDYGTDCTDANRTTFDSTALLRPVISSGTAPFVGTYRPEGSLAVFNEKSGSDVNGTWTLRIADDTAGAVGSIRCCSLFLYPTACTPGGGICELCPDVTLNGSLGAASLQQTGRLTRNGTVGTCASPKSCPGPNDSLAHSYNAHTFRNGPSAACITVSLTGALGDDMFSAAYLNSFDPANLCVNYLADYGDSTLGGSTPRVYSFNAAANQVFVVTVNEITPGAGGEYTLSVTGGNCRPMLNVVRAGASSLKLEWTTASPAYHLDGSTLMNGAPWVAIPPDAPSVVNGKFSVTDPMSKSFYRLHKP
jgi:autotransporter-associated beta strand protein